MKNNQFGGRKISMFQYFFFFSCREDEEKAATYYHFMKTF